MKKDVYLSINDFVQAASMEDLSDPPSRHGMVGQERKLQEALPFL